MHLQVISSVSAVSYFFLMSVMAIIANYNFQWLFVMWHQYFRFMFTVTNISVVASSYLIVAASMERYCRYLPIYWHDISNKIVGI